MSSKAYYDRDKDFWENYQKGRAKVPSSFFERFFDYHQAHNGDFSTVNDIGAGNGLLSKRLADRFKTVVITEPAEQVLDAARQLLGEDGRFRFVNKSGEEASQPERSVDAIFVCNAVHHMKVDQFMKSATAQLKSKGTLFVAYFALPRFDDAEMDAAWFEMMYDIILPFRAKHGDERLKEIYTIENNGTEYLSLPPNEYESEAVRLRINNTHDGVDYIMSPQTSKEYEIPQISGVTEEEKIVEDSETGWRFDMGSDEIEQLMKTYPFDPSPDAVKRHMDNFNRIVAKSNNRYLGYWPVSVTMATRR